MDPRRHDAVAGLEGPTEAAKIRITKSLRDFGEIDGLEYACLSSAEGPQLESRSVRDVDGVEYDGKRVTDTSDGEMAARMADFNRQTAGGPSASRSSASGPRKGSEMKNYLQNGHMLRVTAPTGGIASGDTLIVGSIFGIAAYSAVEGDPVELSTTGVFQLPKASTAVLTVGARVARDYTEKEVTTPGRGERRYQYRRAARRGGDGEVSETTHCPGSGENSEG